MANSKTFRLAMPLLKFIYPSFQTEVSDRFSSFIKYIKPFPIEIPCNSNFCFLNPYKLTFSQSTGLLPVATFEQTKLPILRCLLCGSLAKSLTHSTTEDNEDEIIFNMLFAIIAIQEGQLQLADTLLHQALQLAQNGKNKDAIHYIYTCLIYLAFEKDQRFNSTELFKDLIKPLQENQSDMAIAEVSLKLAQSFAQRYLTSLALEGFQHSIGIQLKKIHNNGIIKDKKAANLFGTTLGYYSQFLLSLGYLEEAETNFKFALEILQLTFNKNDPETLIALNNLASVYCLRKNYDGAISLFQNAIEIAETVKHEDMTILYCNLGRVYILKGLINEAKSSCERALQSAKYSKIKGIDKDALKCLEEIKKFSR